MLFYGDVNLRLDWAVLDQLVRDVGTDALFELLSEGFLKLTYFENGLGIIGKRTLTRSPKNHGSTASHRERCDGRLSPVLVCY